jgi:hypothetical protein
MPKSSGGSRPPKKKTKTVKKDKSVTHPKRYISSPLEQLNSDPRKTVRFPETVGKMVEYIEYREGWWGNFILDVRFKDRTGLEFTFTAKMEMSVMYDKFLRNGNVDIIKDYRILSDDPRSEDRGPEEPS